MGSGEAGGNAWFSLCPDIVNVLRLLRLLMCYACFDSPVAAKSEYANKPHAVNVVLWGLCFPCVPSVLHLVRSCSGGQGLVS